MFTKLGRHEVLMAPYKCCCFLARSVQGRIQGGAKVGHGGPLLQRTSASDWKAIATNRMQSNDLEACEMLYCYIWFHSKVKFLTQFLQIFMQYSVKSTFLLCNFHVNVNFIKDLNALRIVMTFL